MVLVDNLSSKFKSFFHLLIKGMVSSTRKMLTIFSLIPTESTEKGKYYFPPLI